MADKLAGAPPGTTAGAAYPRRWAAFTVVLLGSIMNLLDILVTTIAAPSIRADLGGGPALIQWLGASYTLALAAGLITGGRIGDLYGRKRVFLVGAAGFALASLCCAAAAAPWMLVGARVAQGAFGAMMLPQALGVIRSMFPSRELPRVFAVFGPAMGMAAVAGPVLAGALITANLWGTGWRMIFLINLPLAAFAIVAGTRYLPGGQPLAGRRLDVPGALLAAAAALLLVFPVVQGRQLGWPAWCFLLMALGIALFVIFAQVEMRIRRRDGDPLVVPSLFGNRAFTGGLAAGLAMFTAMAGFALVVTVFLQAGLGFSPLRAGLTVLPQAVGSLAGSVAAGLGLSRRLGRRSLQLGSGLMAVGVAAVVLVLRIDGAALSGWHFAPALLLYGVGLGVFLAPFFDLVLAKVQPAEYGSASGTLNALQQFGGAVGVAVLGTVFFSLLGGQAARAVDADALQDRLAAVEVSSTEQHRIVEGVRACGTASAHTSDPGAVPDACRRLEDAAARAAAAATDPDSARTAIDEASQDARLDGYAAALRGTAWVAIGLLGITSVLTFVLPLHPHRHPRPTVRRPDPQATATG